MLVYFWDTDTQNVALRDPKIKCIRGKTYTCWSHANLTTRDESVKRGGGSVANLEGMSTQHSGPIDQLYR